MSGCDLAHRFLREPSWPGWFKTSSTTKDTKDREGRHRRALVRWLKFNLVGAIGIVVQLLALALFRSGLHFHYLFATVLAVEAAVVHNFLWHERFTWADRPARHWIGSLLRLARFNLSNGAVSIVGNLLLMRLLVGQFRINYMMANLAAIATCSIANFLLSDHLVFRRDPVTLVSRVATRTSSGG